MARLHAENYDERLRAGEALGKLHAVEAVESLIKLLEEDDSGVQSFSATALGQIGDLRALLPLVEQLKLNKPSIYSVSAALYHFGGDAVLPQAALLFDPAAKPVYDLILNNLWMLGDQRAIEPILRFLRNAPDFASKHNAIAALGYLKAQQAITPIAEVLYNAPDADQSWVAAMALGNIGSKQAFDALVEALKGGIPHVQRSAALAFGEMEAVEDIKPLLAALHDPDRHIRGGIAVALGNLREKRAVTALTEALNDPDDATRHFIANALEKITGDSELPRA